MTAAAITLLVTFVGGTDAARTIDLRFQRVMDVRAAADAGADAGQIVNLAENGDRDGTVFVFLPAEGDFSATDAATLNGLAELYPADKIAFYGIISDPSLTRAAADHFRRQADLRFPVLFDGNGELAELFQPTHTPEAFVVDRTGREVYRGRIDDRDLAAGPQATASQPDLKNAMTALAESQPIAVARTEPTGTAFKPHPSLTENRPVTFSRDVAPILYANCSECHRPDQVAPFSLLSYQDAAKRAEFLMEVIGQRRMPPWRAEIGFGHFTDERQLSDRQISLIRNWVAQGAPEGDPADLPATPYFAEGWRLGEPDVVVEAPVPYKVPADGPDIFQHFVLPFELPEDKTLVAVEFRPGNPAVVHHAVIFLDTSGNARRKDEETPEPGFTTSGSIDASVTGMLGVWTPGMTPRKYPEGIGIRVPKKADVVVQLHLHPSGKEEYDQSKIALFFADKPIEQMRSQQIFLFGSLLIDIPAGSERHKVGASITLPVDVTLLSVFPHLHMIGKELKIVATLPNGEPHPLIWIKDWNFYWQDSYTYREPVHLPRGTKIELEAYYDNSATNPFNPSSPPQRVLFGNGSTDEMCFALFQMASENREVMRRMAPAMMQSFMSEWRKADLDDAAKEHIFDEAGKLFGRRAGQMMRQILGNPGPRQTTNPAETTVDPATSG